MGIDVSGPLRRVPASAGVPGMDEEIEAAGKRYVAELLGFHPEIEAELVAPEGGIADATVRIKSPSRQGIRGSMDTVARLTTKYFEDTGYYFQASADYDGPVLF